MFFIDITIRGIAMGGVYALGLGLTLVFGVLRVINFAQGEFYMLGGYAAYFLITLAHVPWFLAIPLAMVAVFLIGMVVELLMLSPIHQRDSDVENPMEYTLITTFALGLLLKKFAILLFGPHFKKPPDYLAFNISLPFLNMSGNMLVALIVSLLLLGGVTLYINYTKRGRSWRALSQSQNGARVVGVNVSKESTYAFAFSVSLAAAAGAVIAPLFLLSPTVGSTPLVKGYEIIAIGGLGSIPGSLAGGLILGLSETFGAVFIGGEYRELIGFAMLVLFLVFRPQGLFGSRS